MLCESKMTYLLISGAKQRSIAGNADTENSSILLRDQLVSTDTLAQVPDTDHTGVVTTDELALVGMNNHIIYRSPVNVIPLQATCTGIPNLHSSVLGASDHPFSLAVECHAGDVVRVAFKGNHGVGNGRLYIKELDIVVARGSQEPLIRGNTKTIDLGVWMLDCTRTDTRERFPKASGNIVSKSPGTDCHAVGAA